jgi:signal peptidase II
MVMGGAIGNLLDRTRLGYVIDFIDWHWYQHHWPTFNIADAFISVGVALLVLDMIINGSLYDEKKSSAESLE